jgi:hypothetical protein
MTTMNSSLRRSERCTSPSHDSSSGISSPTNTRGVASFFMDRSTVPNRPLTFVTDLSEPRKDSRYSADGRD